MLPGRFPVPQAWVDEGLTSWTPNGPGNAQTCPRYAPKYDRIDAALVDLIAERYGYVDRAWQLKMTTPKVPSCNGAFNR